MKRQEAIEVIKSELAALTTPNIQFASLRPFAPNWYFRAYFRRRGKVVGYNTQGIPATEIEATDAGALRKRVRRLCGNAKREGATIVFKGDDDGRET